MALSFAKAGAASIGVGARSDFQDIESEIQSAAQYAGRPAPDVLVVKLDVTNTDSVSFAAAKFEKRFGHVDILVNNAGIVESPLRKIEESDPDAWWSTMEVNVRGTYLVTRAFIPLLLKGSSKTIVNVGSAAQNYITPGASAYGLSKLALARFSEFLDVEYGAQGILAYTIHPGAIWTNLGRRLPEEVTHGTMTEKEPLPADTVVYLTQEKQNWLAGRYISATWDMPELLRKKNEIVQDNLLKIRMLI